MENIYYSIDCPILDLGNREGWTQYIDFIKWEEVDYPFMKGRDKYNRYFIVVKMIINEKKIMQTYFQRYTSGTGWMGCGHATTNLLETPGCMKQKQIELVNEIIKDNNPIVKEEHIPCLDSFINSKVSLYDEKKIYAAIVIQKAWIKCRYDPKYLMCQQVQNTNLDLIIKSRKH
jgi:hypothetical protein